MPYIDCEICDMIKDTNFHKSRVQCFFYNSIKACTTVIKWDMEYTHSVILRTPRNIHFQLLFSDCFQIKTDRIELFSRVFLVYHSHLLEQLHIFLQSTYYLDHPIPYQKQHAFHLTIHTCWL